MRDYSAAEISSFFRRHQLASVISRFNFTRPRMHLGTDAGIANLLEELAKGLAGSGADAAQDPVPRHIYMLWQQGWDAAPAIVKACARSWQQQNPGWLVHLLDEAGLRDLVPELAEFSGRINGRAAQSDLARIALLHRHGGVWADATSFCSRPLDDWLPGVMRSDIFTFSRPSPHRVIASWFIAAPAQSRTVAEWWALSSQYWRLFNRAHRYFWLHYLFEFLMTKDHAVQQSWQAMAKLPAPCAFIVARHAHRPNPPAAVWRLIDDEAVPVHKLTHKWRGNANLARTPLARLTGLDRL